MAKLPAPQAPEKPTKTFAPSAEVTALIAKAKSEHKEGQPLVTEPMLELGSYDGHLEYRPRLATPPCIEKEAEDFLCDRWISDFDHGWQARQGDSNKFHEPQWLGD